jgi:hypothetical protein
MQGMNTKPFGYAGDFQMIDWILTNKADSPGTRRLWDQCYQNEHACRAVRRRAMFFNRLVPRMACDGPTTSVFNLACGPCRDTLKQPFRRSDRFRFSMQTYSDLFHPVGMPSFGPVVSSTTCQIDKPRCS